jgi:hypothetical protein
MPTAPEYGSPLKIAYRRFILNDSLPATTAHNEPYDRGDLSVSGGFSVNSSEKSA